MGESHFSAWGGGVERDCRTCSYSIGTLDGWHHLWCELARLVVVLPCGLWERGAGAGDGPGPHLADSAADGAADSEGTVPGEPALARDLTPDGGTREFTSPQAKTPPRRRGCVVPSAIQ